MIREIWTEEKHKYEFRKIFNYLLTEGIYYDTDQYDTRLIKFVI